MIADWDPNAFSIHDILGIFYDDVDLFNLYMFELQLNAMEK